MVVKSVFSFQIWLRVVGVVLFCGLPAQIDTLTTLICGDNDFFAEIMIFLGMIFRGFICGLIFCE